MSSTSGSFLPGTPFPSAFPAPSFVSPTTSFPPPYSLSATLASSTPASVPLLPLVPPPGFSVTPTLPLISAFSLRPTVPAFPPSRTSTSSSFSVASLLLPQTYASAFLPSFATPAPPFPFAHVPPSRCFAPSPTPSAHAVVSWSLPSVPTCSAPSFSPMPPAFSLVPSAPPPPPLPSSSLPFSSAPSPCASSGTSVLVGAPPSSSDAVLLLVGLALLVPRNLTALFIILSLVIPR